MFFGPRGVPYTLFLGLVASGCTQPRGSAETLNAAPAPAATGATASTEAEADDDDDDDPPRLDLGSSATSGINPDGTTNTCGENVDIVFVMDVTTSMNRFLDILADEIVAVDQALAQLDLPERPNYGLVVFVDDVALLNTGAPYPDIETLQADFVSWSAFTSTNRQINSETSNSTWPENSIDALWVAAHGFQWRSSDTTLRIIIHTTDDSFWEGPSVRNNVMIQHDYPETVQALQAREIRVFSFAGQLGGACRCEDVTLGWSAPYGLQPPIPEATDGQVFSIDDVIGGAVSLTDAIEGLVTDTICEPYTPVG